MAELDRLATMSSAEKEAVKVQEKIDLQKRQKQFDYKVEQLTEQATDFAERYGLEDYRTQMMMNFLDVAIEMKDVIAMLTGVSQALSCIFEAIDFVDCAINMNEGLLSGSLTQNYGFFARIKKKIQMRRAMRNNINRMKTVVDNISGMTGIAIGITTEIRKMSEKMQVSLAKNKAKQAKSNKKNGGGSSIGDTSSAAYKLVQERAQARGTDISTSDTTTSDSSSGSSGDYSDL